LNVEIGAEAALFPEKEYINEIFVAVHVLMLFEAHALNHYQNYALWSNSPYESFTNFATRTIDCRV
jgi:hypothetical protein